MSSNLSDRDYLPSRPAENGQLNVEDIASNVQQQIEEKPLSSVAVAVGAGIGAGLLLTALFSSEPTRKDRLSRQVASYLNSRMGDIRSGVQNVLPDSVADRWYS